MRVKAKLKRLKNPDAQYVSMVQRGANHIPFRILKHDEGNMGIDISNFTRIFKGVAKKNEPVAPQIAGLVVMKSDDMDAVKEAIKKSGYAVDKMIENDDGSVMFAQTDKPEEGATILKMNDEVVMVVKGFEPWSIPAKTFHEALGVEGYYNGLYPGTSALGQVFRDSIQKADSQDAAKTAVQKALSDFNDYVIGLVEALPPQAFRASEAVLVAKMASKGKPCKNCGAANCTTDHKDKEQTMKTAEPTKQPEKAPETEPQKETAKKDDTAAVVPEPEKKTEQTPAEPAKEQVEKAATPDPVLAALTKLTESIDGLTKVQKANTDAIEAVKKEQESLKAQLGESVKKSAEIEKKISGTVIAPPAPGDEPTKESTKKSADEKYGIGGGFYDSAFDPKRRK